jgi:hypothetical protein
MKQVVIVLPSNAKKILWPLEKLSGMIDDRHVLVIATKKDTVDEIEKEQRFQNCSTPWRQGSSFPKGDIAEILTKPITRNVFKFNH